MADLITFSVFDLGSRLVTRTMVASSIELVDMQCSPDEAWVFGHWVAGQVVGEIQDDGFPVGLEPVGETTPAS